MAAFLVLLALYRDLFPPALPQQLSGLWYHNRTNHPEVFANQTQQLKTLVQCDICFRFFPCASSLAKHRKAEHEGDRRNSSIKRRRFFARRNVMKYNIR